MKICCELKSTNYNYKQVIKKMIKQEGVDISYKPPSQRTQQTAQKQQKSDCFLKDIDYVSLYQCPFLTYPPPPPWAFDHAYHPYNPLPHNFPHYDSPFLHLPPPHLQPRINQDQTRGKARPTHSDEEPSKNVKIQQKLLKQKEGNAIPPEYQHQLNKRGQGRKKRQKYTSYYWSMQQNRRYLQFLISHPGLFELSINVKKNLRVNVMMSKKVKTRSPQQCHSHHQKMIKKHGSIDLVIAAIQREREERRNKNKGADQVKVEELEEDNRPGE